LTKEGEIDLENMKMVKNFYQKHMN